MTISKAIGLGVGYATVAYTLDVVLRRELAAKRARKIADSRGRPLLNVGAGTPQTALFGAALRGDVNVDIGGSSSETGPDLVTWGDAHDLSRYPDGYFGAVLASHVLEHLADPDRAIREWVRVTGSPSAVVIVTPLPVTPHAWVHPGHRWVFANGAAGSRVAIDGGRVLASAVLAAATGVALAARKTLKISEVLGRYVAVAYNLHECPRDRQQADEACFVLRRSPRGRVIGKLSDLVLKDVTFWVSESSRQRIIRRKSREVCCFALGTVVDPRGVKLENPDLVRFNPFTAPCFVDSANRCVREAQYALLTGRRMLASGLVHGESAGPTRKNGG